VGDGYREQVTIWLMVLHGHTSFGPLHVEDGEATLRESLGDTVLKQRHLGPASGRLRQLTSGVASPRPTAALAMASGRSGMSSSPPSLVAVPSTPTAMPRGDPGLMAPQSSPSPSPSSARGTGGLQSQPLPTPRSMTEWINAQAPASPIGAHCRPLAPHQLQISILSEADDAVNSPGGIHAQEECITVVNLCIGNPEALVGWRVHVDSMGEGLVVGIKRRLGRTTQHIVSWAEGGPKLATLVPQQPKTRLSRIGPSVPTAVVLRRKESHKRRCQGLAFEVLSREF